eukprot:14030467-Heterocapsa_arctica.AAC.1
MVAILSTDAREACRPELPLALPAAAAYPLAGMASNKPPTALAGEWARRISAYEGRWSGHMQRPDRSTSWPHAARKFRHWASAL